MITELAKHIENLLLENDCVIIPGFGGFIAQYVPARRVEEENVFYPPYRTVGFNPRLNLNDGLLVQSYMQVHDLNFPEASRWVDDAVAELNEQLSENGEVVIHGVGKLVLNIENAVAFYPDEDGISSSSLYGLSSFEMFGLSEEVSEAASFPKPSETKSKHNTLVIHINRRWLNYTAAVAATVLLFFFLSVPVENTYIEPENYASLGNAKLFDCIRSQSMATSLVETVGLADNKPLAADASCNVTSPAEIPAVPEEEKLREETHAAQEHIAEADTTVPVRNSTPEETSNRSVCYHIIVASVTNTADAEKAIRYFSDKGYPGGTAVEGDNRVRIALYSFADRKAADAKWAELRKIELFQNAWILTSRNKSCQ